MQLQNKTPSQVQIQTADFPKINTVTVEFKFEVEVEF